MNSIIRPVRDIDVADRRVLEHVIGQRLEESQEVIFQVVPSKAEPATEGAIPSEAERAQLPEWCNVYAGLTDEEIGALEEVILRRSKLTRPSE